jgi:hypothetical protein
MYELEKGSSMKRALGIVLLGILLQGTGKEVAFATKVLEGTRLVRNPEAALNRFDGVYAGLELNNGLLELALKARNVEGYDISVHAQRPQYGILPETMNYGLFAKADGDKDWTFLGWGNGKASPEYFEMGKLAAADRIMIVFKDVNEIVRIGGAYRTHPEPYLMNIDAVAALH